MTKEERDEKHWDMGDIIRDAIVERIEVKNINIKKKPYWVDGSGTTRSGVRMHYMAIAYDANNIDSGIKMLREQLQAMEIVKRVLGNGDGAE